MDPASPTKFPQLNAIVAERAARILGANFAGAYLPGSFAVGDADRQSDCDFLIPVRQPVSPAQEAGLPAMHAEFPDRPEHWAQHLEGSYPRWPNCARCAGWAGSGCTSTTAGGRCSGPRTATPRWSAGRCASAASHWPANETRPGPRAG